MIKAIHNWVSQYIHVPSNLEKLILFLLLAWIWLVTLPYVGLIIVVALGIYAAVCFPMDAFNCGVCAICGLTAVLHIIDIIGRVKGDSDDVSGSSEKKESEDNSDPTL